MARWHHNHLPGHGGEGREHHQFGLNGVIPQVGGEVLQHFQPDQQEQQPIQQLNQPALQPVLPRLQQRLGGAEGQLQRAGHQHRDQHHRQHPREVPLEPLDQGDEGGGLGKRHRDSRSGGGSRFWWAMAGMALPVLLQG